uniref:uncharacterized protein LOC101608499 n=1 Tax=Jaculus jaculus TaxID=51337 RepID=UPI001E1B06EE|nr:uncharacterized protein LOC101608499 [Jaculus jaculus]
MTKGERLAKSPATQRLVPLVCTPQDITGYFSTGRSSLPCKDGAGSLIHSWRRPGKGRRAGNPGRTGLLQLGEGRATGQAEPSSPGTPCTPCRLSLEDDSRRVSPKASGFQSHRGGLADRRGGALRDGSAAHFRPTLPSRMEEAPRPRGRLSRRRPPPGAGARTPRSAPSARALPLPPADFACPFIVAVSPTDKTHHPFTVDPFPHEPPRPSREPPPP